MATKRLAGVGAVGQRRALESDSNGVEGTRWSRLIRVSSFLFSLFGCLPQSAALESDTLAGLTFTVRRSGNTYYAESGDKSYSGTLKVVVESAVARLDRLGGGTVSFGAGDFDLGSDNLTFKDTNDITFAGQGIDATTVRNFTDAARDSEPLSFTNSNRITIRDLTVSAGGSLRTTSDAIDSDGSTGGLIERVKVTASRARGIVYDGKDASRSAEGNVIRDCVVAGIPSAGIELLGAERNRVEGCRITDVGGNGIYLTKASANADQPNKSSNDNTILRNYIANAGHDGIAVNSGSRNVLTGNTVLNSSDDAAGRDGIRITSYDEVACDDNQVESNAVIDNQAAKTQKYGLHISSPNCSRTVVEGNDFRGNLRGTIRDLGTGTVYSTRTDAGTPAQTLEGAAAVSFNASTAESLGGEPVGQTRTPGGLEPAVLDPAPAAQVGEKRVGGLLETRCCR